MAKLVIKEVIEGTWHYHIGDVDNYLALCGRKTMNTVIPFSSWGKSGHLNARWCEKCYQLSLDVD